MDHRIRTKSRAEIEELLPVAYVGLRQIGNGKFVAGKLLVQSTSKHPLPARYDDT